MTNVHCSQIKDRNAVRDAVHGWIRFTDTEKDVIDSPFVQRLRRISQLSLADEVFPCGNHTRFTHSLGVMKFAGKVMKQLMNNLSFDVSCEEKQKCIKLARIGGLLHDIGHGSFSHAWDRSVYAHIHGPEINNHFPDGGHDIHRLLMVRYPLLAEHLIANGTDPNEIIKVWEAEECDGIYFIIKTVIGGPLGADRMDFILRDSHFTGTQHLGTIASDRIISNCFLIPKFDPKNTASLFDPSNRFHICYRDKCLNDIIQALDGRRFMYQDVYFHKTVMAATLIIEKMIEACIDDLNLIDETKDLNKFVFSNEHTLIGKIMSLPKTHISHQYCEMLLLRKLPSMKVDMHCLANQVFDEVVWKKEHPEHATYDFIRTRPITGIDPDKFDYYNIAFITRDDKIIDCRSLLNTAKYSPIAPYYLLRGYSFD